MDGTPNEHTDLATVALKERTYVVGPIGCPLAGSAHRTTRVNSS